MELKVITGDPWLSAFFVSIAPLWNWKCRSTCLASLLRDSFNRTFMELKVNTSSVPWAGAGFNRTFMELKVVQVRQGCSGVRVSIAPLWNWKRVVFGLYTRVWGFNRTFMELKARTTRTPPTPATSFNRTFMELKVWRLQRYALFQQFQSHLYGIESWYVYRCMSTRPVFQSHLYGIESKSVRLAPSTHARFQSHLYGIEREIRRLFATKTDGFNRTFMELKVGSTSLASSSGVFQSHLYGIESFVWDKNIFVKRVSIAPLWNWKQYSSVAPWPFVLFQSHLYGIESGSNIIRKRWNMVSIAPLWNWKVFLVRLVLPVYCFNRTFMELKVVSICISLAGTWFQSHLYGIESLQGEGGRFSLSVSIAPLWNWKYHEGHERPTRWRFNRTFMELKEVIKERYAVFPACFNRTFMELKEVNGIVHGQRHQVSIAPLWNWKIKGHFMHICCASQEGSAIQML